MLLQLSSQHCFTSVKGWCNTIYNHLQGAGFNGISRLIGILKLKKINQLPNFRYTGDKEYQPLPLH